MAAYRIQTSVYVVQPNRELETFFPMLSLAVHRARVQRTAEWR